MRPSSRSTPGQRNARLLAVCQGLFIAAISIDLTLTALTGHMLAPNKALSTLPFALITVAGAVVTWFASLLMQRIGRRNGFTLGALAGAAGGGISVWAVFHSDFWAFCAGTALVGVFQAFAQYYRLAAADAVEPAAKTRAISVVMAGGVIAAIAGPALANASRDLFAPVTFAGAYLMVALLALLSAALLWAFYRDIDAPVHAGDTQAGLPARPLREVARQPIFVAALANNVVGSVSMMFIMTAAPLAAVACSHTISDGAGIMQWHLVGMYAPALFAGALIQRFGLARILWAGMLLNVASALIAMGSPSLPAFYAALFCLGVGWNFMFVGGTTLLAQSYRPAERARAQGAAEMLRYAATALATLAAGPALDTFGWEALNAAMLPVVLAAGLMTWYWARGAARQAAMAGQA
ncbi:Riboflavin transporter RfnT [Achromobacter deleyi]|uniref:Riboflavin transporter RfnT n=1 Tax=Achromobacter deleyi TaxID=1353891 RepID=A0A6S7AP15_9BURK|nr:MFS transporter [Achromobacter deleyi]CAB3737279.1 Riboflavin transporter RfnT [Achromobacter deleyi]CAB3904749.1 Riboflavin transporter RfnT [Achromobacter deleyi]CAB3923419.1 Riboflavin transporter RfnT [Achromobacter deleyi]